MPKQRQKQSQKQSVKVVVNLAEKQKKRKRRAKRRPVDGMSQFQQLRQPQVIYYQQDTTSYLKPSSPPPSILSPPVKPPPIVNTINFGSLPEDAMDVGVGRHGIEEIIDTELPLKPDKLGKQLAQQISPPPQSMTEGLFEGQGDIEPEVQAPRIKSGKKGTSKAVLAERYLEKYGKRPPSRMTKSQLMVAVFSNK